MQAEPVDEQVRLRLIIADYAKICEASSREIAGLRCRIKKLERLLETKAVKCLQPCTDDSESNASQQALSVQ
jgi:hypothetical protein